MGSNCRSKFDLSTPKASEVLWCTIWLSSAPSTKRCQETWVARRYYQNVKRCIQKTRLTNSPLIHIMCALWQRLDEIRAQRLRQHPEIRKSSHSFEIKTLKVFTFFWLTLYNRTVSLCTRKRK